MSPVDFSKKIVPIQIALNAKKKFEKSNLPPIVKSETFDFFNLPHNINFSDLKEKMHPISVEGLEHITGIYGRVEKNDNVLTSIKKTKYEQTDKPSNGALVWGHVSFFLEGKTMPFNSSKLNGKEQVLKLSDVLPGILVAARYLHAGQCGQFLLPPHTMYGEPGSPPIVPKSATILLVMHSLKWIDVEAPNRYSTLDDSLKNNSEIVHEIIENSNNVAGNYFNENHYKDALTFYKKINNILNDLNVCTFSERKINSYKIRNFINMAICYNFLNKPNLALCHLDEVSVLEDYKCDIKYLYTRGRSLMLLNRYDEALNYFLLALKIDPNNTELGENLLKLDTIIKKQKEQESSYLKTIFKAESKPNETQNDLSKLAIDLREYFKTTTSLPLLFDDTFTINEKKEIDNITKTILK